jgi:hypothetical protein
MQHFIDSDLYFPVLCATLDVDPTISNSTAAYRRTMLPTINPLTVLAAARGSIDKAARLAEAFLVRTQKSAKLLENCGNCQLAEIQQARRLKGKLTPQNVNIARN